MKRRTIDGDRDAEWSIRDDIEWSVGEVYSEAGSGQSSPVTSHGTILDLGAAEVRRVASNTNILSPFKPKSKTVRGLNLYREAYREERVQERIEKEPKLSRFFYTMTDLRAHWDRFALLVRSNRRVIVFMVLDLLVDLLFSLMYLVEMSVVQPIWVWDPYYLWITR